MAFPTTNTVFRKFLQSALTVPVAAGAAGSTARLGSANTEIFLKLYTSSFGSANFDTDVNAEASPWGTTNEVASANYSAGGVAIVNGPSLTFPATSAAGSFC